jgi:AbiEi antitoxin C-terminal domain
VTRAAELNPTTAFSRAEARAAGIPVRTLLGPRYHKVFYDLYVDSSVHITPAVRARAALRACGESSYASHFTAAELWGASVPQQPETHVSVRAGTRSVRCGIRAHLASAQCQVTTFRGVRVSTPEQTFLDLAPLLQLLDLVALGDSLVRKRRTTPEQLVATAKSFRGRGARLARRAAALVRHGVDSPMESRTRLLLVLAGLPEPVVNFTIRNADGSIRMRFTSAIRRTRSSSNTTADSTRATIRNGRVTSSVGRSSTAWGGVFS